MKHLILVLAIALSFSSSAQISVNLTQDAKLLFAGDDKGNEPLTIDLALRVELRGYQRKFGYMFVAPEAELAELEGGTYKRYSVNVGYTFNRFFEGQRRLENLTATASVGYGIIDYNGGYTGFGTNWQLGYEVTKRFEVFLDLEGVDRKDLQIYNRNRKLTLTERVRVSGKFGFKITFN